MVQARLLLTYSKRLLYHGVMLMTEQTTSTTACPKCGSASKRFGRHPNGLQRYRCLACKKTFTEEHKPSFRIEDYLKDKRGLMATLSIEGCSIRTAERMSGIRAASICKLLVIAGERWRN